MLEQVTNVYDHAVAAELLSVNRYPWRSRVALLAPERLELKTGGITPKERQRT